jgi:hypothetical protein
MPEPFIVKFVTFSVNAIELPAVPPAVAVTITFAPDRAAVAVDGMSALIAAAMLLPSVVVLEAS